MSCASVGRLLRKGAGLKPAQTMSVLSHPQIKNNLARLGYTFFNYFGPVDFLLNDCFHCSGVVDNNQIERLLARELIDQEFKRKFINGELDPGKFPFPYRLNRWGISQMRKQTLVGKLVCRIEGFTVENLPKGPDDLMAAIVIVEKQIGKAIVKVRETVEVVLSSTDYLDMDALIANEQIQQSLRQNFRLAWLPTSGKQVVEVGSTV